MVVKHASVEVPQKLLPTDESQDIQLVQLRAVSPDVFTTPPHLIFTQHFIIIYELQSTQKYFFNVVGGWIRWLYRLCAARSFRSPTTIEDALCGEAFSLRSLIRELAQTSFSHKSFLPHFLCPSII